MGVSQARSGRGREGIIEVRGEERRMASSMVRGRGAEEEAGQRRDAVGRMAGAMQILRFTSTPRLPFSHEARVVFSDALYFWQIRRACRCDAAAF
jgi:hypothetical protein